MKYDTLHLTHDILYIFIFCFLSSLSVSVRFSVSATIRKHQEIQCLPYAGFIKNIINKLLSQVITALFVEEPWLNRVFKKQTK